MLSSHFEVKNCSTSIALWSFRNETGADSAATSESQDESTELHRSVEEKGEEKCER